ncbi:MAG: TonB-dependent receptor plug domain-containing protein [Dissulfuribacterales bacterium]
MHIMFLVGFFLCFFAGNGFTEETKSPDTYTLGEIVVTGKKINVADTAISTTMTSEDIKATNSKTVAEALKFAPGVTVTWGRKNEPEISVHGFGQEKTLFLIDGIPYYETYYGKLNLDQIPIDIISKIEITKNAPSVLYGANAQIAVINVITKKGATKPTYSFTVEMGENDTHHLAFAHGNQVKNINYWFNFVQNKTDGWRLSDDFEPKIATKSKRWMPDKDGIHENGGFRNNSDIKSNKFWGRIGLIPTKQSEYFISFHTIQSEFGHPPSTSEYKIFTRENDSPGFSSFSRFDDYDDWGVDFSGKQLISDDLTIRGKLFYHDHTDKYVSYDGPDYINEIATSNYKDNLFGVSLITDFSLADWHAGHISLNYHGDMHEGRDDVYLPYNEYKSHTGSIGTEHNFFNDDGLSVFAGCSYDWFRVSDAEDYVFDRDDNFTGQEDMNTADTTSEFNPMIGFNYDLDKTELFGSVARKSKFPSLFQLYSSRGGNPDLDSEVSINYTLGLKRNFTKWFTTEISGFYHDISDWISRDYYEEDYTGIELYENMEKISMKGFEAGLYFTPHDYFRLNVNYTYNDAKNESSKRVTDRVIGVPENKLDWGCTITIPKILAKINISGYYIDNMYDQLPTTANPDDDTIKTDDYWIVNGRIATKKYMDMFNAYVEVTNIFDKDYEQGEGFPAPGRNFCVGLNADF